MRRMISSKAAETVKKLAEVTAFNEETNTLEVGTNLEVDGKIKDLSKIVDANGNPRFAEGNISLSQSDLTLKYGKWSLSGTHLMVVAVIEIPENISKTAAQTLFTINLPKYIIDKIMSVGANRIVHTNTIRFPLTSNTPLANYTAVLSKYNGDPSYLTSFLGEQIEAISENSAIRIQFDILIDNE